MVSLPMSDVGQGIQAVKDVCAEEVTRAGCVVLAPLQWFLFFLFLFFFYIFDMQCAFYISAFSCSITRNGPSTGTKGEEQNICGEGGRQGAW
jgi:hypothetical protein